MIQVDIKKKDSSTRKLNPLNKRRRRSLIVEDDSVEDHKANNKRKVKESGAKSNKSSCS